MPHTITIKLSDAGQRAAILAGEPAQRVQTYEVPEALLPRLLAFPWTAINEAGESSCEIPPLGLDSQGGISWGHVSTPVTDCRFDLRPPTAESAIRQVEAFLAAVTDASLTRKAELAAEERKKIDERSREREIALAWAKQPIEQRLDQNDYWILPQLGWGTKTRLEEHVPEATDEVRREIARRREMRERLAQEDRERSEMFTDQENREALVNDSNALARYQAGKLPENELRDTLRDHYLPLVPSGLPVRYITIADLPNECEDGRPRHSTPVCVGTDPLESMTADEWSMFETIKKQTRSSDDTTVEAIVDHIACKYCDAHRDEKRIRVARLLPSGREVVRRYGF